MLNRCGLRRRRRLHMAVRRGTDHRLLAGKIGEWELFASAIRSRSPAFPAYGAADRAMFSTGLNKPDMVMHSFGLPNPALHSPA